MGKFGDDLERIWDKNWANNLSEYSTNVAKNSLAIIHEKEDIFINVWI